MITVETIMDLRPCQPTDEDPDTGYPEHRVRELFGGRESVTLLDICDDERVPIRDRQWVLHRMLPDALVHELACRYAEHALERQRRLGREPDPRSVAAIAARRRWLRGELSDDELHAVYWDAGAAAAAYLAADAAAAWAATAYWAATAARAAAAYWAAYWAAADDDDAERRWQLRTLRRMIEEDR